MAVPVRRNFQRDLVIWLDKDANKSSDFATNRQDLQKIVNSLKTFSNPNECVDYLFNMDSDNELVFFIVSDSLGENVIPSIHSMHQIHRIYVYCSDRSKHLSWTNQYNKVNRKVFQNVSSVCQQLKEDRKKYENEFVAISFISQSEIQAGNRQDPSFIYNQLLKDILLNERKDDSEDSSKKQMLDFCREYYQNNNSELEIIDEFEREFFPEHAFYWYTRDCFLYKILNKALWTPEPAVLYKLRYFIRHLNQQIAERFRQQEKSSEPIKIFRGQGMPKTEFNKVRHGIGGLLSFNNFLSTTLNRAIAIRFAEVSKYLDDETSVIFSMTLDPSNLKYPFIILGNLSYYRDLEEEVLCSMGTVFRVDSVRKMDKNQWEVNLTLTDNSDDSLAHYTEKLRKKLHSSHLLISLVKLMDEMGQYKMIDKFADIFAKDNFVNGHPGRTAEIQHALGTAFLSAGNTTKALEFLKNSLTTYLQFLEADHFGLSPTYNNIGSAYLAKKDYKNALEYQQKALDCQINSPEPNLDSVVTYTANISTTYQGLRQYDKALEYLNRALELQKQYLGNDHPALATIYSAIARICQEQQEFEVAGMLLDTIKGNLLN